MAYWLMKSEPEAFGIDDLQRVRVEPWDGIRNYQVRNMIRDEMKVGDMALFYHSNVKPAGVVGSMVIVRDPYPDDTAFMPEHKYYDPKSTPDNPRWYRVDVEFKAKFSHMVTLDELRQQPELNELAILRRGNRLSIVPVTPEQWDCILRLAQP